MRVKTTINPISVCETNQNVILSIIIVYTLSNFNQIGYVLP